MEKVSRFFCHLGLQAHGPKLAGGVSWLSAQEPHEVLAEGARLLQVVYARSQGGRKAKAAIRLLEFLLEPDWPKRTGDREMARSLFKVVDQHYRKKGREGSSAFILGCLLWLEGEEKEAVKTFLQAANCGKESCGGLDWIRLVRLGTVLADKVSSKRALNRFKKLAQLHGVFSSRGRSPALVTDQRALRPSGPHEREVRAPDLGFHAQRPL